MQWSQGPKNEGASGIALPSLSSLCKGNPTSAGVSSWVLHSPELRWVEQGREGDPQPLPMSFPGLPRLHWGHWSHASLLVHGASQWSWCWVWCCSWRTNPLVPVWALFRVTPLPSCRGGPPTDSNNFFVVFIGCRAYSVLSFLFIIFYWLYYYSCPDFSPLPTSS